MTGVEDQLEETELVLEGLREYHSRVKDRQRLEDEIEYNLQMAGQHLMDALAALRQLGDDDTADDLNDALHTVYRADGEYLDRYIETGQELQEIAAKLRQVRRQRTRLQRLQDSSAGVLSTGESLDRW